MSTRFPPTKHADGFLAGLEPPAAVPPSFVQQVAMELKTHFYQKDLEMAKEAATAAVGVARPSPATPHGHAHSVPQRPQTPSMSGSTGSPCKMSIVSDAGSVGTAMSPAGAAGTGFMDAGRPGLTPQAFTTQQHRPGPAPLDADLVQLIAFDTVPTTSSDGSDLDIGVRVPRPWF